MSQPTIDGNALKRHIFLTFIRRRKGVIIEVISALFILLFVYTSVSKLSNIEGFISVLSRSPLIGTKAEYFAWGVPIIELIVSILLFIPRTREWGLISSAALMTIFSGYLFYIIYFSPELPCSCGGVLSQLTWREHLVFNIIFLAFAATGIWLNRKGRTSARLPNK